VNFSYAIYIQPLVLALFGSTEESAQILGLILSLGTFSAVIPLLLGFLAEKYGRKRLLIIGEFLSVFGLLGLASINNSPLDIFYLIIGIFIFNLGIGLYDPPFHGLIYESANENKRGLIFAIIYNSSSMAGLGASLIIQSGLGDMKFFFQVGILLILIAGSLNLITLRDQSPKKDQINLPILRVFRDPASRFKVMGFTLDAFVWGMPVSISYGVFVILFGVSTSYLASLTFIQTIFLVITQFPAGYLVDRFGSFFGLITGELLGFFWLMLLVTAIFIPTHALNLILLSYAMLGLSVAFWRPSTTLTFIQTDPDAASTNFGIIAFFSRLGWVPSSTIGGFIFSLVGFPPLLIITFLGTIVIILLFYKMDQLEIEAKNG
jgi:MFS family permease